MSLLVSVIIPVFNVKPYLSEALESVLNQRYKNLEIIVIDDGSTDGSGEVCDEYAKRDKRIQVIHQANNGLSEARNVGLEYMTGDYVVFLDADDAFHPLFVETLINAAISTNSDVSLCKFSEQHTTGTIEWSHLGKAKPDIEEGTYSGNYLCRSLIEGTINYSVWNKLYSVQLWETIRFPSGHVYEDVETTYLILDSCKKMCVLDSILYIQRKRPGSITDNRSIQTISDGLLALDHLESHIRSIPEVFSEEHIMILQKSQLDLLINLYVQSTRKDEKSYKQEIREEIISIMNNLVFPDLSLRTRLSYILVRYSPWVLKIVYSAYNFFKQL